MQLSLLQENLNTALSIVSRFTQSKAQLPILGNILFISDEGRLRLSATTLDLGINYRLGAKIDQEGSFTIPTKELVEFVSYLPTGKIDFSLNENNLLTVSSPKAKSTFTTTPSTDFPPFPSIDTATSITLPAKIFSETLQKVIFASATDDSRPVLTSVLCKFNSDDVTFVATDGFRLSLFTINLEKPLNLPNGQPFSLLIPSKSLQEVSKLSKNINELTFGISTDHHQVIFILGDLEVSSRLIEGDFPDYQRIIPQTFSSKFFLNVSEFSQTVKISSVFAKESANVVRLNFKNDRLLITANAPQVGQNQAETEIRSEGDGLEIAFNYKFINDFLSVCNSQEITIQTNDSLSPVLFVDPSTPQYTHIIMPVRIQD